MVFPTCESFDPQLGLGHQCHLNIVYNKQRPLCKSSSHFPIDFQKKGVCRPPGDLCAGDPDFFFDFSEKANDVGALGVRCHEFAQRIPLGIYPHQPWIGFSSGYASHE